MPSDSPPPDVHAYIRWLRKGDEFDHLRAYAIEMLIALVEGGTSQAEMARRQVANHGGKFGSTRLSQFKTKDRPDRGTPPSPDILHALSLGSGESIGMMWRNATQEWQAAMKRQASQSLPHKE